MNLRLVANTLLLKGTLASKTFALRFKESRFNQQYSSFWNILPEIMNLSNLINEKILLLGPYLKYFGFIRLFNLSSIKLFKIS